MSGIGLVAQFRDSENSILANSGSFVAMLISVPTLSLQNKPINKYIRHIARNRKVVGLILKESL